MTTITKALPSLLQLGMGSSVPPGASKAFCALIKAIGEAGSNHEEDRAIRKEVVLLQQKLKEPNIPMKQMKEYLVRLIYCEMLGHSTPFGYIHAVKFAQQASLFEKRVGYLAVSLMLHENHELILLLINTIQKDLKSTNIVEVCMALTVLTRLINAEMIPAVQALVEEKLNHPREIVRKKAVLAIHRFYIKSPSSVSHLNEALRRSLCDSDPGVMAASLNALHDMAAVNPSGFKDLAPTFVNILKQVIEARLSRDFEYHKVPAPWIQIKLLRILRLLGADDQATSECMYEVIRDCLRRADFQTGAAYAVVYECMSTVTSIYPSSQLVELGARTLGRFLRSDNNNLKYLGITALIAVVKVNPVYAAEHQMTVIDCLDDPDDTLKRKTLDLLCTMANPANVEVISQKLIAYLKSSVDPYLRKDLVPRIIQLSERFAPSTMWYVETMNELFAIAGDTISFPVAHNLMRLIAEGTDDPEADRELRENAVSTYIDMLELPSLSDMLARTICWVVGEYAYLATDFDQATVLDLISSLLTRSFKDEETKGWVLSSVSKLVAQTGLWPAAVANRVAEFLNSASPDLRQRAVEIQAMVKNIGLMRRALPVDASCEEIEVDVNLGFLTAFLNEAKSRGAKPYRPAVERERSKRAAQQAAAAQEKEKQRGAAFNFTPYERPEDSKPSSTSALFAGVGMTSSQGGSNGGLIGSNDHSEMHSSSAYDQSDESQPAQLATSLQVTARRWGRGGDTERVVSNPNAPAPQPAQSHLQNAQPPSPPPSAAPATDSSLLSNYDPSPSTTIQQSVMASLPPAELTKKQQLASQLFAGSTTATSTSSNKPKSRARKTEGASGANTADSLLGDMTSPSVVSATAAPAPPQPSRSLDPMADLMSLSMSTAAAPIRPTEPTSFDPLGSLLGGGAPSRSATHSMQAPTLMPAAPTYQQPQSKSLMDGDLLGGLGSLSFGNTNTKPAVSQPPSNASSFMSAAPLLPTTTTTTTTRNNNSNSGDLLGDLMGSSAPSIQPMSLALGSSSSTLSSSAVNGNVDGWQDLPSLLASHPHSEFGLDAANDSTIRINFRKVWKPEGLVVVLYIFNKVSRAVSGTTQLDIQGMRLISSIGFGDGNVSTSLVDNLTANGYARHVLTLTTSQPAAGMVLRGQHTYIDGPPRTVYFTVPIAANDFLRLHPLTVQEFGVCWEKFSAERKQRISPSCITSMEMLQERVGRDVGISAIQAIGKELICSAQILEESSSLCLLHIAVLTKGIEVTVHSSAMPISEFVVRHCASVWKA